MHMCGSHLFLGHCFLLLSLHVGGLLLFRGFRYCRCSFLRHFGKFLNDAVILGCGEKDCKTWLNLVPELWCALAITHRSPRHVLHSALACMLHHASPPAREANADVHDSWCKNSSLSSSVGSTVIISCSSRCMCFKSHQRGIRGCQAPRLLRKHFLNSKRSGSTLSSRHSPTKQTQA